MGKIGENELDNVILFSVRHLRISHHTRTCLPQNVCTTFIFFISNGEETLKKHVYAKFCGQTRCIKRHAQCFNSELNAMKLIPILHMYAHVFYTCFLKNLKLDVCNLLLFLFLLLN